MSVPLDRLYNFLQTVCNQDIIIYRFFPHGSKKWADCVYLSEPSLHESIYSVPVICHDQEPINEKLIPMPFDQSFNVCGIKYQSITPVCWFKILSGIPYNHYDRVVVVHSELNSKDVNELHAHKAVGAYYWSHAIIAKDWFRYAEHDCAIKAGQHRTPFLIYNRAWAGTREYRLKFAEMLINQNLHQYCNIKFAVEENGKPYTKHKFANEAFKTQCEFENFLPKNTSNSSSSADYDSKDYNDAAIEIVLETLFDESKWHLTEKTLRPIAVGKPFVLAATPGSLEYLKLYGFKTFSPWIDESYDQIQDPVKRLEAITKIIKDFVNLDLASQSKILAECQEIADYNKKLFFSDEFFQQVVNEYKTNLVEAVQSAKQTLNLECFDQWLSLQTADIVKKVKEHFPLT